MNLPTASEALMALAGYVRPRPPQPEAPTPDPRQIIARPYGKSVLQQILDAPNLATAEHIYRGASGGAREASSGTRAKWLRALRGVERREALEACAERRHVWKELPETYQAACKWCGVGLQRYANG